MTLLHDDLTQGGHYFGLERQLAEVNIGKRRRQQPGKFTLRTKERNRSNVRRASLTRLDLVDEVPKFKCNTVLAGAGCSGRDLHRDREELGVIAIGVAAQERLHLLSRCHIQSKALSSSCDMGISGQGVPPVSWTVDLRPG